MASRSQAEQTAADNDGGMSENDPFMRGGRLAAKFCIGFAFLSPCLLLWKVVF